MHPRVWIFLGSLWAALGVALGAFGAHAFQATLEANGHAAIWETAVRYQLVHALALLVFGLYRERARGRDYPGLCFLWGSFFFSGSLYALSFDFAKSLMGPLTPIGGFFLIVGWIGLALEAWRRRT